MSQEQKSQTNTNEFEVLPDQEAADNVTSKDRGEQPPKPVYSGPTPGEMLRTERERRQLSLEDIVTQSRMSMETIKALEEDRDPPQNAWVYVRGYYRKYARVLGMSEQEVLDAHERYTGGAPSPDPVSAEWAPMDVSPSSGLAKFIMVLIAGILFGGLAWWIVPMFTAQDGDTAETGETAPATRPGQQDITVTRVDPVTGETAPGTSAPPADTAFGESAEQEAAAEPDTEAVIESSPQAPAAAPSVESAAGTSESMEPAAAATADEPRLVLEFTQRSWTRITDATGKKLLDGIVEANERHELPGQPPFKVFLGNAPGVKVSYQGRLINTEPYTTSSNTARFTVEAEPPPESSSAP